jgi:hypothetical protein
MQWVFAFGGPMLVTIPVTVLLCRFWVWRRKSVSYGTMIAGTGIVALGCLILFSRGECFSLDYWSPAYGPKHKLGGEWPFSELRFLGFVATICLWPALGVVAFYQSKRKRDETQAA